MVLKLHIKDTGNTIGEKPVPKQIKKLPQGKQKGEKQNEGNSTCLGEVHSYS